MTMEMYEYKTEVLTSVFGRDKMRLNELDETLSDSGRQGWELVSLTMNANIKGEKDGHLLVFKRRSTWRSA